MSHDPWLSADAIAARIGVTSETVYAWIARAAYGHTRLVVSGRSRRARSTKAFEWAA